MESILEQKIIGRQKANHEILKFISNLVDKFPDQRFGQILSNYILERDSDPFYEESVDMLKRIKNKENKI